MPQVVIRPDRTPPDTPEQREKDDLKRRIREAFALGDMDEGIRLQEELAEKRAAFYRSQMAGGSV